MLHSLPLIIVPPAPNVGSIFAGQPEKLVRRRVLLRLAPGWSHYQISKCQHLPPSIYICEDCARNL